MTWGYVAVGAGTLLGGYLAGQGSKSAADAQASAADRAAGTQQSQYAQTRADNMPFLQTGVAGNARLKQLLGLDTGYSGPDSGLLTRKFSSADLANDPVYSNGLQFGLDQGTGAINARALATGSYDSGATLKALTRYANDYGTTKAGDAYNRFNADNTNIYNRLAGVSGGGQTAANTVTNAGINNGNNMTSLITGAGNANAAGIVGQANAWGGALGGLSGTYQNYNNNQLLQQLLTRNGYSGGSSASTYDPSQLPG